MKIRTGFVSNSSTTSFCIYGVYIEDLEEIKKHLNPHEIIYDRGEKTEEDEDDYDLYEMAEENDLEYHSPEGDSGSYIGVSWSSIGDNETGKQFQERVAAKLKEVFGITQQCDTHSEAWYNG